MGVDKAVYEIGLTSDPRIGYNEGISSVMSNGVVTREYHAKTSVEKALISMYERLIHCSDF